MSYSRKTNSIPRYIDQTNIVRTLFFLAVVDQKSLFYTLEQCVRFWNERRPQFSRKRAQLLHDFLQVSFTVPNEELHETLIVVPAAQHWIHGHVVSFVHHHLSLRPVKMVASLRGKWNTYRHRKFLLTALIAHLGYPHMLLIGCQQFQAGMSPPCNPPLTT